MAQYRIQAPVTPETRKALQALADVRKCSLAALCGEFLDEMAPIAMDMAKALKMAQKAPAQAQRMVMENLDRYLAHTNQIRLELEPSPKATRRKKKAG